LSSTDPVERNFVTILKIVALHITVLSGYFLRKFLRHSLRKERYTNVQYMNNFCSILGLCLIFEHYISQHCEMYLHVSQELLSMLNKQRYRDNQQESGGGGGGEGRFDGKQWAGVGE
jgi:hypothetical protein